MKNRALHREIARSIEPTSTIGEYKWKRSDPSLLDQASRKMVGLDRENRWALYLKMIETAPNSTAGSRAKWRRRLSL